MNSRQNLIIILTFCSYAGLFAQDTRQSQHTVNVNSTQSGAYPMADASFQNDLFTGAATFKVSLSVPPGINGFTPNFALQYNSSRGNGILGVGWELIGFSYIERSIKKGVPKYSVKDEYVMLLNGQHYELRKHPETGEYHTNPETFMKFGSYSTLVTASINGIVNKNTNNVVSPAINDNNPMTWTLIDKNGTVYIFGGTETSRVDADLSAWGKPNMYRRWLLSEISEVHGNSIKFEYCQPSEEGEVYLKEISYGYHDGTVASGAKRIISFIYTDSYYKNYRGGAPEDFFKRPDVRLSYLYGTKIEINQRLERINVAVGNKMIRSYGLEYELTRYGKQSLLTHIRFYGDTGEEFPQSINFGYESSGEDGFVRAVPSPDLGWAIGPAVRWIDLDGDNRTDRGRGRKHSKEIRLNKPGLVWDIQDAFGQTWRWSALFYLFGEYSFRSAGPYGQVLADVNYDGYPDLILSQYRVNNHFKPIRGRWIETEDAYFAVKLNNANGSWRGLPKQTLANGIGIVERYRKQSSFVFLYPWAQPNFRANGVRILDANGDRYPDIVSGGRLDRGVKSETANFSIRGVNDLPNGRDYRMTFLGKGDGTWEMEPDPIWKTPAEAFLFERGPDKYNKSTDLGVRYVDINGDGLLDVLVSNEFLEPPSITCWLNNGHGYTRTHNYFKVPIAFATQLGTDSQKARLIDINGDALVDVIISYSEGEENSDDFRRIREVYFNTGNGAYQYGTNSDYPWLDELPDFVATGRRWYAEYNRYDKATMDKGVQFGDFDGDGRIDIGQRFKFHAGSYRRDISELWINRFGRNILTSIELPMGGLINIEYEPSSKFRNVDEVEKIQTLPMVFPVVTRILTNNGLGKVTETEIEYEGGRYDYQSREFRGFAKTTVTDGEGYQSDFHFHQSDGLKGHMYNQVQYDSDSRMLEIENLVWQDTHPNGGNSYGVYWPHITNKELRSLMYSEDGSSEAKLTSISYSYDSYGNVIRTSYDYGDRTTRIDSTKYAYNLERYIVSKPVYFSITEVTPAAVTSTTVAKSPGLNKNRIRAGWTFYDGNELPDEKPTYGDATKVVSWLTGDMNHPQNPVHEFEFDEFGNEITMTDPKGRTTKTKFDPVFHTFPILLTNPLGHWKHYEYYGVNEDEPTRGHGLFGSVKRTVDANGMTTETWYDAFGRQTKQIVSPDSDTYPTLTQLYQDDQFPFWTQVSKKISTSPFEQLSSLHFFDGMGSIAEIKIIGPDDIESQNIAAGFPVTGTFFYGPFQMIIETSKLTDGKTYNDDPESKIELTGASPTITIDLGGTYPLKKIIYDYDNDDGYYQTDFSVYIKESNFHNWELLTAKNGLGPASPKRWQMEITGNKRARFVKIVDISSSSGQFHRIYEIEIYNTKIFTQIVSGFQEFDRRGLVSKVYDAFKVPFSYSFEEPIPSTPKISTRRDALGRHVEVTTFTGNTNYFEYNGWDIEARQIGGKRTKFVRDGRGLTTKIKEFNNGDEYISKITYDVMGNITRTVDAEGNFSVIEYDNLGRRQLIRDPASGAWRFDFDAASNIIRRVDAAGNATTYEYDDLDRRFRAVYSDGQDVEWKYDGEKKAIRDWILYRTGSAYDVYRSVERFVGRQVVLTHSGASLVYNENINNGASSEDEWASLDGWVYISVPTGSLPGSTYRLTHSDSHSLGRLSSINAGICSETYTYDVRGRTTQRTRMLFPSGESRTFRYFYDGLDNLRILLYPDNERILYEYRRGFLRNISGLDNYVQDVQYDATGRVRQFWLGNRYVVEHDYFDEPEKSSLLRSIKYQNPQLEYTLSYSYLPSGLIQSTEESLVDNSGAIIIQHEANYDYDSLYRLTDARLDGLDFSFQYSPTGRIIRVNGIDYNYGEGGAPGPALTSTSNGWNFGYDSNGNIDHIEHGSNSWNLIYDTKNIATKVFFNSQNVLERDYHPVLGLIEVRNNGERIVNFGDGYREEDGIVAKNYSFGSINLAQRKGSNLHYLFSDHLATRRVVLNRNGTIHNVYEYAPFGSILSQLNQTSEVKSSYLSQEMPAENLGGDLKGYWLGKRLYIPSIQRFASPDELVLSVKNPQTWNRYSFAGNNPVNFTEINGHFLGLPGFDSYEVRAARISERGVNEINRETERLGGIQAARQVWRAERIAYAENFSKVGDYTLIAVEIGLDLFTGGILRGFTAGKYSHAAIKGAIAASKEGAKIFVSGKEVTPKEFLGSIAIAIAFEIGGDPAKKALGNRAMKKFFGNTASALMTKGQRLMAWAASQGLPNFALSQLKLAAYALIRSDKELTQEAITEEAVKVMAKEGVKASPEFIKLFGDFVRGVSSASQEAALQSTLDYDLEF